MLHICNLRRENNRPKNNNMNLDTFLWTSLVVLWSFILFTVAPISCYEADTSYFYDYETKVEIFSPKNRTSPIVYDFKAGLELFSLASESSKKIMGLRVNDLSQDTDQFDESLKRSLLDNLVYFELETQTGRISHVLVSKQEPKELLIFKKSLVDLFNTQFDRKESMIGECETDVNILRNDSQVLQLVKTESNCKRRLKTSREHAKSDSVLNSLIERSVKTQYVVTKSDKADSQYIQSIDSVDDVKVFIEFNPKAYQQVKTEIKLRLRSSVTKHSKREQPLEKLPIDIESDLDGMDKNLGNNQQDKYQKNLGKKLKAFVTDKKAKTGKRLAAKNFVNLIKSIRSNLQVDSEFLDRTLLYVGDKMKFGLDKTAVEVLTSAQTPSSLNTLKSYLEFGALNSSTETPDFRIASLVEDYLLSGALTTRLNDEQFKVIDLILEHSHKFFSDQVKERAILALGSLVSKTNEPHYMFKMSKSLRNCKSDECRVVYLESLRNSKSRLALDTIVGFLDVFCELESSPSEIACYQALKSMNSFNSGLFLENENRLVATLLKIFYNKEKSSYSTETRIEALNILFDKYLTRVEESYSSTLLNILVTIKQEIESSNSTLFQRNEFANYCIKLLNQKAKISPNLSKKLDELLILNPKLRTRLQFHNGISAVSINQLKKFKTGSLTSNLRQLILNDGSMRSLDFSVAVADDLSQPIVDFIKFDLDASHLSKLSQLDAIGGSAEPARAAIHLSLLGKKLVIKELFRGQASLVSLIWSLPTKMTSLFNTNLLISDQNEYIVLKNGLIVNLETLGALSFDLSAASDVSVWGQYGKFEIRPSTGIFLEQKLTLFKAHTPIRSAQYEFGTDISIKFNLNLDLNTKPLKTCIKMDNKKFYLKESIQLFKSNRPVKEVYTKLLVPANSFMFSRETVSNC